MWRRREKPASSPEAPEGIFLDLRSRALDLDPGSVGIEPSDVHPNVWGALMEMGLPEGVATLVSLADGTTSVYTSTGGGIIGGGEHESVARESHAFLVCVEEHLGDLQATEPDLPSPGRVHLHALTFTGRLGAVASEEDLGGGAHPLSPVFYAGHEVITALRQTSDYRRLS